MKNNEVISVQFNGDDLTIVLGPGTSSGATVIPADGSSAPHTVQHHRLIINMDVALQRQVYELLRKRFDLRYGLRYGIWFDGDGGKVPPHRLLDEDGETEWSGNRSEAEKMQGIFGGKIVPLPEAGAGEPC